MVKDNLEVKWANDIKSIRIQSRRKNKTRHYIKSMITIYANIYGGYNIRQTIRKRIKVKIKYQEKNMYEKGLKVINE